MTHRRAPSFQAAIILLCLLFGSVTSSGLAQRPLPASARQSQTRAARGSGQPKLVVVITVDQFRYDYLERFGDLFAKGGFRRLVNEGAVFTNANYDYVPTVTAAGHAAIFTGSVPAQNGIVGNYQVDRESGEKRPIVSDNSYHILSNSGPATQPGAASPRVLQGTTIGDQMRLANNFQSKVIAISQKDRAAVLPGGQLANGAYWYANDTGNIVSSDYYFKELPAWVKKFNTAERPDKYFGAKWEHALPDEAYKRAQSEYLPEMVSVIGQKFPYTINGGEARPGPKFYRDFEYTPFASEYLVSLAKAAIDAESLGADQFPDLLAVSFSAPDLVGHYYGPDSQEIEDIYIRLDRVLADFLNYVDRRVGLANTVVVVSADHGVAPIPEYMHLRGIDAMRIPEPKLSAAVEKALEARFGGRKWLQTFENEQLYLDRKVMAERKADPAEVERVAGEAALTVPGIANYFTRTQILEGRLPSGALSRRVMNGFNRARSGDVWIITKPFYFVTEFNLVTRHASGYSYDTHVPVIFFGAGVRAGRYNAECSPSDIAPTLASLLGVEPPSNRVGRVLTEAIASKAQAAAH
jgi:predicted AlkP superfamily pyrophosphatase or phosphodiesterase